MNFLDFLSAQGGGEFSPLDPAGLTSTRIVKALLEVPKGARNQDWSTQFLAYVADAAFFTRDPCVIAGSDFRYFALHSTPGPLEFPTHVIHHMLDDFLLEHGLGVVINPAGQHSDWAFSYGDLLHFHLHGSFYPAQDEGAVCAASPQARLPQVARDVLRGLLQRLGVADPRVMFGACDHAGPGSLELVFSFTPQEFKSVDDFRFAMNRISWYLPRNYSYSVAASHWGNPNVFVTRGKAADDHAGSAFGPAALEEIRSCRSQVGSEVETRQ